MKTGDGKTVFHLWRVGHILRLFSYAIVAFAALICVGVTYLVYDASGPFVALLPGAFLVILVGRLWWTILRPKLIADESGLIVVEGRKPTRIDWADVYSAESGYFGTLITLRDGTEVFSRYPQRSNLSQWLKRRSDSDILAEQIEARRQAHDADSN